MIRRGWYVEDHDNGTLIRGQYATDESAAVVREEIERNGRGSIRDRNLWIVFVEDAPASPAVKGEEAK